MKELIKTNHNYFFSVGNDCDNMRHGLNRINLFSDTNNDIKLWLNWRAGWDGFTYKFIL